MAEKNLQGEEIKEYVMNLMKERGLDPEEVRKQYEAKLQAKAGDYYFALNQILGCILDSPPGTSDRQMLNQIEAIAKKAFDYDKEEN